MSGFLPIRISGPAALFTLAEAKRHLRVDGSDEDALIGALVAAATQDVETRLERALVTQTWRQDFAAFGSCLRLPLRPVQSISSVKYYDADNESQTVDAADYELLADVLGAYVAPTGGASWPSDVYERGAPVQVTFVAGYGAASAVPQDIRAAVLLRLGQLYEKREDDAVPVSTAVDRLLRPYLPMMV